MTAGAPTIGGLLRIYKTISTGLAKNRGTFANRPTTGLSTGLQYFATDIGATGAWLTYNGSRWKPASGVAVLYQDAAAHTAAGTGAEANYFTVTIPAGLLSANGGLRIFATMNATGANGTKTLIIRHNTTSGAVTGGTALINGSFGGNASTLSVSVIKDLFNNASVSSQASNNSGIGGYGSASSTAVITGSIDTSAVSYINFNVNGNASDTVGYQCVRVEWIEP
jgi:hypothetical protein